MLFNSPPLSIVPIGLVAGWLLGARTVMYAADMHPDIMPRLGYTLPDAWFRRERRRERMGYEHSDLVLTTTTMGEIKQRFASDALAAVAKRINPTRTAPGAAVAGGLTLEARRTVDPRHRPARVRRGAPERREYRHVSTVATGIQGREDGKRTSLEEYRRLRRRSWTEHECGSSWRATATRRPRLWNGPGGLGVGTSGSSRSCHAPRSPPRWRPATPAWRRWSASCAARLTADGLFGCLETDGFPGGRIEQGWRPAVDWACLTGTAQVAACWLVLHGVTGQRHYPGYLAGLV